jgi:transketolase
MTATARTIRKNILKISRHSGHGHIPTCFSVVEALCAVYGVMRHDPADPGWPGRDLFVLSKGHAALAHYCVLAHFGYFDLDRAYTFGAFGSSFGCHADRFKIPGIEASTGSLGHGVGLAAGMALALSIDKSPRRVFTLVGDGEANEGSVWEAVMVAANLSLANLTIVYDNNMSHARGLQITNPAERFRAFGCDTEEVDGHDLSALGAALTRQSDRPRVLVAQTCKGHPCRTLAENHYAWHRRSPQDEELAQLMGELDAETI